MTLLHRIAFSVVIGILASSAVLAYSEIPVPRSCGSGGFGFTNAGGNSSVPSQYGNFVGNSWPVGSAIGFSWVSVGNNSSTLSVLDPAGQVIYSSHGISGRGSFTAGAGTYNFALPPAPPRMEVSVSYECTTTK